MKSMRSFRGRRNYVFWAVFPAPPLTDWSLWSLSFTSEISNREAQVLLHGLCKKPLWGVGDGAQDQMLVWQWGRGEHNPKGVVRELLVSPGNKPEAYKLCSWCQPRLTGWSPLKAWWIESRLKDQPGIREHLEARPGTGKMGQISQCRSPQSKGIRQGLCWDSSKVRICPRSHPQASC